MKQNDDPKSKSVRKYHCVVFACSSNSTNKYKIDSDAVNDYLNALTEFQKKAPFDGKLGILKEDQPIFYYQR